ncbi:hypothetical protein D3C78_1187040 [compost metagenome]
MVWMHVGDDDPYDGQPFELRGEDLFPLGTAGVSGHAAVDNGPAFALAAAVVETVAQQPEIDVVECERQPHANPLDAGSDLQAAARLGHELTKGVMDFVFKQVHGVG